MRHALLALAVLALAAVDAPATAASPQSVGFVAQGAIQPKVSPKACTPIEPKINIVIRHDPIAHDFGQRYGKLGESQHGLRSGEFVMGLYKARLGYSMNFKYHVEPRPNWSGCVSVREVNLEFGMRDRTILVAREIAQGSCAQREVLKHEQGHAAIDEAMIQKAAAEMDRYIRRSLASFTPMETWQPQLAAKAVEARMQHAMTVAVNRIEERRQRIQSAHDSPEEYARLAKTCNGQLQQFISPRDARSGYAH